MIKKTLIIGAGEAGKMTAKEILDNSNIAKRYELVGFLDDDEKKKSFYGIPVLGKISQAKEIIHQYGIQTVIIAIPSAPREITTQIVLSLSGLGIEIKIVPGIYEIIEGTVSWRQIRKVQPEDLLGREEIGFDIEEITPFYQDKTIFVTGAGGSIGSEIIKQLLKLPIRKVVAFNRGENNLHNLLTQIGREERLYYVVGDIRDYEKIHFEIQKHKPDVVFHAAAHKHVPMMEEYPEEAIKTNVIGTYYTALASQKNNVQTFVMVSTDKAVRPKSVMGASKRLAEKIILSLNPYGKTRFILTRFGNVLGSQGSVIPTFLKQIEKGGPITITHPDMERYFMSIPEASRLVIKSAAVNTGNIFVLQMGKPIKIVELAKNLIRLSGYTEKEIPIIFTGLRKGEKLYEELSLEEENQRPTPFKKLMVMDSYSSLWDLETIHKLIEEFQEASQKIEREKILDLLMHYVPEYQSTAGKVK